MSDSRPGSRQLEGSRAMGWMRGGRRSDVSRATMSQIWSWISVGRVGKRGKALLHGWEHMFGVRGNNEAVRTIFWD